MTGTVDLAAIRARVAAGGQGLLQVARLKPGKILVLGCSTSEVLGSRIGSGGNCDVAVAVLDGLEDAMQGTGLYLAVQCCEHLNRCLAVEREVCEKYNLTEVSVLPVPRAGGAAAAAMFRRMADPVVVESVQAHAGMDIGDTFIGMHLLPVAVPVRLPFDSVGQAHLTLARSRPRLIGGKRATYAHDELDKRGN